MSKTADSTTMPTIMPRGLSREQAATYIGGSVDVIDRMIYSGVLPVVRLPVKRSRANTAAGVAGTNRRIIIDREDLDKLIENSKEISK